MGNCIRRENVSTSKTNKRENGEIIHQLRYNQPTAASQVVSAEQVNLRLMKPQNMSPSSPLPLPPPPPPPSAPHKEKLNDQYIFRALFDYTAVEDEDLTFKKGDLMEIIGDPSEPWLHARHLSTNAVGYIPSNFVIQEENSPKSMDGYFNITRRDAERHLLMPGYKKGTYIIRPASSPPKSFALSIKEYDERKQSWCIKHYRIKPLDDDRGYFIRNDIKFATMFDLIKHYQVHSDGLSCSLTDPCPQQWKPPPLKEFEVARSSLIIIKPIGQGSFGEVYLAKYCNTFEVAVKTLKVGTMDADAFLEEANIMHSLVHPKIVQIMGICSKDEPHYIITEYMTNGALLTYLKKDNGMNLKMTDLIDIMTQICDGMQYLESRSFVHRDLRAANCLVGEGNFVKVADFGLARVEDVYKATAGQTKFPIKWTAPEAATGDLCFTSKSDVWSFGIVIYEILTYGGTPYPEMRNRDVIEKVVQGYRLPNPWRSTNSKENELSTGLYNAVMLNCWQADPLQRPTFEYLFSIFDDLLVSLEKQYGKCDS